MENLSIQKLQPSDYQKSLNLWKRCGITLATSEEYADFKKFLKYNPSTSLALYQNQQFIGCVLGGYDGRRGLVHHLAIEPDLQSAGHGRYLMDALESEFRKLGVDKVSFWVLNDNKGVIGFYKQLGYQQRNDLTTLSKFL